MFMTRDIIKKKGVDLNENSYLAINCNLIVGRFSGTYTFAMTKESYFDNPCRFAVFTVPTLKTHVWTYNHTPEPKAKIARFESKKQPNILWAVSDQVTQLG